MNKFEIQTIARELMEHHGLLVAGWRFAWDNGKRRAGACHYTTKTLSFSYGILGKESVTVADVRETVLHEIAHALVGHAAAHGPVFVAKLKSIGGTGARTHKMETVKGRYDMHCSKCGIVGNRHQRQGTWKHATQANRYFTHKGCGGAMWLQDRYALAASLPVNEVTVVTVEDYPLAKTPAPVNPNAPTCYCRCGGNTKGGKYLPGHDARHVSEIFGRWLKSEFDITGAVQYFADSPKLADKLAARIDAYTKKHYNY